MAKYEIQNINFYNFNETSFIIDIIISFIVIMHSDKYKKIKFIKFNNQK